MSRALRIDDIQSSLSPATRGHVTADPVSMLCGLSSSCTQRCRHGTVGRCAEFTGIVSLFSYQSPCHAFSFFRFNSVAGATIDDVIRVHGEAGSLRLSAQFRDTEENWCRPRTPMLPSQLGSPLAVRNVGT